MKLSGGDNYGQVSREQRPAFDARSMDVISQVGSIIKDDEERAKFERDVSSYIGLNSEKKSVATAAKSQAAKEVGIAEFEQAMIQVQEAQISGSPVPAEALRMLESAASKGNVDAMYNLGTIYSKGSSVNLDKSLSFMKQAAGAGDTNAVGALADMSRMDFEFGMTMAQQASQAGAEEPAEAMSALERSLSAGNVGAALELGNLYKSGSNINLEKAEDYFRQAEKSEDKAVSPRARMERRGVESSRKSASSIYNEAVSRLENDSFNPDLNVGENSQLKRRIEREAVAAFEKAAVMGDVDAMYNTGIAYYEGKGVSADMREARKYFQMAASNGDSGAQAMLMQMGGVSSSESAAAISSSVSVAGQTAPTIPNVYPVGAMGLSGQTPAAAPSVADAAASNLRYQKTLGADRSKSGFNSEVINNQVRERLTSFGYEKEEVDSLLKSGGKNTGIPNMPTMTIPSSSRSSATSGSLPPVSTSASASASAVPMNPMTEEMRKSFREIKPEDVATIDFSKIDYGAISKMFGEGFADVAKTAVKIALEEVLKSRQ
jgi:TPR repeat protein